MIQIQNNEQSCFLEKHSILPWNEIWTRNLPHTYFKKFWQFEHQIVKIFHTFVRYTNFYTDFTIFWWNILYDLRHKFRIEKKLCKMFKISCKHSSLSKVSSGTWFLGSPSFWTLSIWPEQSLYKIIYFCIHVFLSFKN